jgi:hypothetical protein
MTLFVSHSSASRSPRNTELDEIALVDADVVPHDVHETGALVFVGRSDSKTPA